MMEMARGGLSRSRKPVVMRAAIDGYRVRRTHSARWSSEQPLRHSERSCRGGFVTRSAFVDQD
jgi:hypothetical protein